MRMCKIQTLVAGHKTSPAAVDCKTGINVTYAKISFAWSYIHIHDGISGAERSCYRFRQNICKPDIVL